MMIVFHILRNIIKDHIPCSFAYKVVCIDDKYCKDVVLYRGKDAVFKFIECIFKECGY